MKTLESPPPPPPPPPLPSEPSTPARSPFSSFPSLEMETVFGFGFGSSRSGPPRRRSLRLASMSPAPASAVVSSGQTSSKRKRIARASSAEAERKGRGGETRVLERSMASGDPVDMLPSMNSSAADGVEERYMRLRSGSRIAPRRIEVDSVDSNLVQDNGDQTTGEMAQSVLDVDHVGKSNEEAVTFGIEGEENGVLVAEDDIMFIKKSKVELDGGSIVGEEVEELSRNRNGSVKRRRSGRPKGQKQLRVVADRSKAIDLSPKYEVFKPEERGCMEEDEEPDGGQEKDFPSPFPTCEEFIKEEVEAGYMKLRSGFEIAKARLEVNGIDSDLVQKDRNQMVHEGRRYSYKEKGKAKLEVDVRRTEKASEDMALELGAVLGDREEENGRMAGGTGGKNYNAEEKGKGKFVGVDDFLSTVGSIGAEEVERHSRDEDGLVEQRISGRSKVGQKGSRREAERNKAMELAPKFAFFKPEEHGAEGEEEEEEEEVEDLVPGTDDEDWPGPFSTAMKIIEERAERLKARELRFSSTKNNSTEVGIQWMPSKDKKCKTMGGPIPLLKDLCLKVLSDNAEEIESLEGIPDVIKHKLILMLCSSRKMSARILGLLMSGTPTEIHLSDCSWATEAEFEGFLIQCNTDSLKVAQHAAVAISRKCSSNLQNLDLSFCRKMTDEALGLIVDNCSNLRILKLFGCNQVTDTFLDGHSNPLVSIIGLRGNILHQIEIPEFLSGNVSVPRGPSVLSATILIAENLRKRNWNRPPACPLLVSEMRRESISCLSIVVPCGRYGKSFVDLIGLPTSLEDLWLHWKISRKAPVKKELGFGQEAPVMP
ncbi:putative DNA repair protein rhp7 [Cocos nucifera]|uniref:Putative DNA repair protein rhp7 n=1 Tax=Cocos nucifera TaxID=13894 RepID=A0A8K0MY79_COCNU|nr:putative DNA repair protein rhp7 [Cocos nucifera]